MKTHSTTLLYTLSLMLALSGCLRQSEQVTVDDSKFKWEDIRVNVTTSTTTTSTLPAPTTTLEPATTIPTTTQPPTTTSSTTTTQPPTTTTHKQLATILPARLEYPDEYRRCEKNLDCVVVGDCCGIGVYGRKYAINSGWSTKWERTLSEFCKLPARRKGCGWMVPNPPQAKCVSNLCTLTYGGFTIDNLPETPEYNWSFIYRVRNNTNGTN